MAAERFRTIARIIGSELDKGKVKALKNAVSVIDNAGGKIQNGLNNAQNRLLAKYTVVGKKIAGGESGILEDSRSKGLENPVAGAGSRENEAWTATATAGIIRWWQLYQRLIGLDKLEVSKLHVDSAQEKLFQYQGERRHLNREATKQNEKLKEVYAELLRTKRDDPSYVQLTILENKTLQDLRKAEGQLNLLEKEERDHFTLLATAIKEYHVTQDMCTQRYKYISIIASILLAVISLVASTIYNNKRTESGRIMFSKSLQEHKLALTSTVKSMEEYVKPHVSQIVGKLNEIEKAINTLEDNNLSNETSSAKLVTGRTYAAIGLGILALFLLKGLSG